MKTNHWNSGRQLRGLLLALALLLAPLSLAATRELVCRSGVRSVSTRASAKTAGSREAGVIRYHAADFVAIHCRASVVFPYPAGATRRMIFASVSSSSLSRRGRSMKGAGRRGGTRCD